MFCGSGTIVKNDIVSPVAQRLRCRRWQCEDCLPMRRAEVKRAVRAGDPRLMITLTSEPSDKITPAQAARDLVRAWQLMSKRLARQWDQKAIQYFAVIEATKRGWPHLHILVRETFIDHAWLRDHLKSITGAYIVWVTRLNGDRHGANYIAKYLGKAPHQFQGCKRYWRSQGWIIDRDAWLAAHAKSGDVWFRLDTDFSGVVEAMRAHGYEISELTHWKATTDPGHWGFLGAAGRFERFMARARRPW